MTAPWQELCFLTITEVADLLRSRKLSPVELTRAHIHAIENLDPTLHTYVTLLPDKALAQARNAEQEMLRGEFRSPLHGIPYALKDLSTPTASPPKPIQRLWKASPPISMPPP